MARLVSKTVTPDVSVVVNTKHTDGTIDKNVLNIGDVTTLRYIANNQLLSITGRVTAFGIKDSSNSLIKFKKTNTDTFAADAVVQTITLDASEQYSSNLVTINAREIVEAQGVDDVVKVDVVAEMNVTVESTYTDGSVDSDLLKTDYLISDITINNGYYELMIRCDVSKGTYIRVLGETIAEKLGTVGHLVSLRRTKILDMDVNEAHKIKELNDTCLISIADVVSKFLHTETLSISSEIKKARHGGKLSLKLFKEKLEIFAIKDPQNHLIAIYKYSELGYYECVRGIDNEDY